MELEKFVELFAEQFDNTEADQFTAKTIFKNLEEWDSLTALSVIVMGDEEMEERITGADIRNSDTIEDLYNTVVS